jgi:3'(2'), 5'-bisphosphate nucleotidase
MSSLAAERATALDAVLNASRVCREVQQRLVAGVSLQKGDKSPVTVADFAAQAIVSHLLHEAFPAIPLIGEEDAAALREPDNVALKEKVVACVQAVLPTLDETAILAAIDRGIHAGGPTGRFWTLDPIDGTKGFLRLEQYAVALALIEDGEVVLGVLGCPNLPGADGTTGAIFVGVKGEGAFQRTLEDATERSVRVAPEADVTKARFSESVESGHTKQDDSARVAELLGITEPAVRMDSQAKYAAVARGDAHVYLRLPTRADYVERIWDHAAGWRVIVEGGGRVTDVRGEPLDFGRGRGLEANKGVIATNGLLHDQVVAVVRQVLGM